MKIIKMYRYLGMLFLFLLLFGCIKEGDGRDNSGTLLDTAHKNKDITVENKLAVQKMDVQQEEVGPKFTEIKKEIDYWYNKGGKNIGQQHYDQLMGRLKEVEGKVSDVEIKVYIQKLNAIELVESGSVNEQSSGQLVGAELKNKVMINPEKEGCVGNGSVVFTHAPMKVEDIEIIQPTGLMIGGHVTPIDHGYYNSKKWKNANVRKVEDFVEVFAPAAGVVEVQSMPSVYASSTIGDYRLVIHHTCTFYTIFIHVNQISEKLAKVAGTGKKVSVVAGEVIGRAPAFDFSVHNDEVVLKGFIVPSSYEAEPFKIHTVDMFDSFQEPLRTQLLARNIRQAMPRGGKIDYDIDGKLVGNWFEEGTNAYFGKKEFNRMPGYWQTHAAFAYDALYPRLVIVSLGDFGGEAMQFAVKGNGPNPKDVDVEDGVVKYELVKYDYKTESGDHWDRWNFVKIGKAYGIEDQVEGVVVVQMVDTRKVKMEVFVGETASTVKGFSGKEKVYVR